MPEEYLKIDELAARMSISPWKVKELRRARGLPYEVWGQRTVRYPWGRIVEEWMPAQRGEN